MYRRPGGRGVTLGASEGEGGGDSNCFYHGVDARRNGVGVIRKEGYIKSVLVVRNFKVPCKDGV